MCNLASSHADILRSSGIAALDRWRAAWSSSYHGCFSRDEW